jgi:hypothetical protein
LIDSRNFWPILTCLSQRAWRREEEEEREKQRLSIWKRSGYKLLFPISFCMEI